MAKFRINVTSYETSEVINNETGKIYVCKNTWYPRKHSDGKTYKQLYVVVTNVEGKKMKDNFSFPWKAEILENGKLRGIRPIGLTCETDLAGKRASAITEDMFE